MDEGLAKALATPARQVTFELGGGASSTAGPFVFGEVTAHPWTRVGVYARGEAAPGESSIVAGVKGAWDFM